MRVTIRLFAAARDAVGQESISVDLPPGKTNVAGLRQELQAAFPSLARLLPHLVFAVDAEYAADSATITAESEIAGIPPVSGG
jgi:molybdopterin converting factor subunit 1